MFYNLSNTASREILTQELGMKLQYPYLYNKNEVLNGLNEINLLIRTKPDTDILSLAIWGIVPDKYEGDWQSFQNIRNTLNFEIEDLKENKVFANILYKQRCVIVVTGFYTAYINEEGEVDVYCVHLVNNKPFYIAGIYTELSDGFVTCALLLNKDSFFLKNVHNLDCTSPIVLTNEESEIWLDDSLSNKEVINFIETPRNKIFENKKIQNSTNKKNLDKLFQLRAIH